MTDQEQYLLLLAGSPLLVFVVHVFFARFFQLIRFNFSPMFVALLAVVMGGMLGGMLGWQMILTHMKFSFDRFWTVLYGIIVYGGFSFSYFQLFGMTETARRIRILSELNARGRIERDQLNAEYHPAHMISVRLARLISWKQLECVNGRYFLRRKLLYYIAKIIDAWACILGFYHERFR